jgi:hypothetical protein
MSGGYSHWLVQSRHQLLNSGPVCQKDLIVIYWIGNILQIRVFWRVFTFAMQQEVAKEIIQKLLDLR